MAMRAKGGVWTAGIEMPVGLRRVVAARGEGRGAIALLVRPVNAFPARPSRHALGCECQRIGAWPERGVVDTGPGLDAEGGEQR